MPTMPDTRHVALIFKRELKAYFESPVAYVFLVVFLLLTAFLTFSVGNFYERRIADLEPFFFWHPWVFLLLVPAATMSLWAEERRSGTIELLLTMPVSMTHAIIGKFLAAWLFMVITITLTIPTMVGTVVFLGSPDLGVIVCGYIGSFMLAGAYVAVGMLMSSVTRNQVISFVLALMLCLLLVLAGWNPVTQYFVRWAPAWLVEGIASLGFMPHFEALQRGVVDLSDVTYYLSVIAMMCMATYLVIDNRKSA
jgi:ABC-2 type transport system permease protein